MKDKVSNTRTLRCPYCNGYVTVFPEPGKKYTADCACGGHVNLNPVTTLTLGGHRHIVVWQYFAPGLVP